jgi:hypothetical protein
MVSDADRLESLLFFGRAPRADALNQLKAPTA